jgi:tetratricopeptide (TPR) repeat protein
LSAAQRIEAHLGGVVVGPDVRARAEQALRDVQMLAELDDIRLRQADTNPEADAAINATRNESARFNNSGTEQRYAAAFSRYGLEVAVLDAADAASHIRASAIHEALLAGLNGWMQVQAPDDPQRARLRQVADAADDNAWRRAFREAALAGDVPKLKALSGQSDALAQPPAMLAWIGSVLRWRLPNELMAILRQAQQRHPGDFWINYNLGVALPACVPPEQAGEAVGYFRAAIVVRPSSAEAHSALGHALLFYKHDADAAIVALQQARAIDPKFGLALPALAKALKDKGRLDEAIACYREAFELSPKDTSAHFTLADGYLSLGRQTEAIATLRQAMDQSPKDPGTHIRAGHAFAGMGQWDEAVAAYQKAIPLEEPAKTQTYVSLARALTKKGLRDEAIATMRRAIALSPNDFDTHIRAGEDFAGMGLWDEAVAAYRKAIDLDPAYTWTYRALGRALLRRWEANPNDWPAGCRKALELYPNMPAAHVALGQGLVFTNRAEARAAFQKAIELDPTYSIAHVELGHVLAATGGKDNLEAALAAYSEALKLNQADNGAWCSRGNVYRRLGQRDKALEDYNQAIALVAGYQPALHGIGELHFELGEWNKAIVAYSEAVKCLKLENNTYRRVASYFGRGQAYQQLGKWDEAVADFRVVIALEPTNNRVYGRLGMALLRRKEANGNDWVACCRKAVELYPNMPAAHVALGQGLVRTNRAEATAAFQKAIELDPKYFFAHLGLGDALAGPNAGKDDLVAALVAYSEAHKLGSRNYGLLCSRGNVYRRLGLRDMALDDYNKALALFAGHLPALFGIGEVHFELGEWDKAIVAYSEAVKSSELQKRPDRKAASLSRRSRAYQQSGKWDQAVKDLSEANRIAPQPPSQNNLAWLLATCPEAKLRNPQQAVELADAAVKGKPREGTYWNTLGAARYRAGDWKAAVAAFDKSMELGAGGDASDRFFLAMTHWKMGDPTEARKWYDWAVEWVEENAPALAKNPEQAEELRRFRSEAEEVLELKKK